MYDLAPVPAAPAYLAGKGFTYCAKLGEVARRRSATELTVAWIAALLGACAVIVGSVLEPAPPDAERRWIRHRAVLLLNFGWLLVTASYYEFSRADAASLAGPQPRLHRPKPLVRHSGPFGPEGSS